MVYSVRAIYSERIVAMPERLYGTVLQQAQCPV